MTEAASPQREQHIYLGLWDDLISLMPFMPGRFLDWSLLPRPMLAAQVYEGHSSPLTLPVLTRHHPASINFQESHLLRALHEEFHPSRYHLRYTYDAHQPASERYAVSLLTQQRAVQVISASLSFGLVRALKMLYLPAQLN